MQHGDAEDHVEWLTPDGDAVLDADVHFVRDRVVLVADVALQFSEVHPAG